MGYPSWEKLSNDIYEYVKNNITTCDKQTYIKFLKNKQYPEVFQQAERDLGSREKILRLVKYLLKPTSSSQGQIYELLAQWPFKFYLTTNYDHEIFNHLNKLGLFFNEMNNSKDDLVSIRNDTSEVIVKLHSDFNYPEGIVLTLNDYDTFSSSAEKGYYRQKLETIFQMFDVLIIGHSMSDRDLKLILQFAKNSASPEHPIYMVASDITSGEAVNLLSTFNIDVLPYKNENGTHGKLKQILNVADKWIMPRSKRVELGEPLVSDDEIEAATSLLIYRKMHEFKKETEDSGCKYFHSLILKALDGEKTIGITFDEMIKKEPLANILKSSEDFHEVLSNETNRLVELKLITNKENKYFISDIGLDLLKKLKNKRSTEEDKALGQFVLTLRKNFDDISIGDIENAKMSLKHSIVGVFKKRGIALANAIFSERSVDHNELSDIFQSVKEACAQLDSDALKASFMEAVHQFLINPTEPQKKYLSSISQGFFLYHLIGLDPKCQKIRRDILTNTIWFCDSSILLSLVAIGSFKYEFAKDLFGRMVNLNAHVYTTNNLVKEVWNHLNWAINLVRGYSTDSPEFLAVAMVKGGYKQNLFIDGFIQSSVEGKVSNFQEYVRIILPSFQPTIKDIKKYIESQGIKVLSIESMTGYNEENLKELEKSKEIIREYREKNQTYRSNLQVNAEAEILEIIRGVRSNKYELLQEEQNLERIFFVSHSQSLDYIAETERTITWSPEALYRYLTSLPGETIDPNLLQKCMLQQYFYAGVEFFDVASYKNYFGSTINTAKISFKDEKERYLEQFTESKELELNFEETSDLKKPFFVLQMKSKITEKLKIKETALRKELNIAKKRVKELESEKDANWKLKEKRRKEQEENRLRNLKDPKHISKKKRQLKKKKRKKNK
jgi:hypothetical protein